MLLAAIGTMAGVLVTGVTIRQDSVLPTATDPAITIALAAHRAAIATDAPLRESLLVYLHGAGGTASSGTELLKTAAELGFHSIGITYFMNVLPSQACMSANFACHEAFRREIIEGIDYSPQIAIARPDSIENRIAKLLLYLELQHPGEGWTQYLDGEAIRWDRVVVYGHSMGGSNTALLSELHELRGACISSPATDINGWFGGALTPASRVFGFSHVNDNFAAIQSAWVTLGLSGFGALQDVAMTASPFGGTHRLSTSLTPAGAGTDFHNSPTTDGATPRLPDGTPVYKRVWRYMLLGGIPACPGDANADASVDAADLSVLLAQFGATVAAQTGGDLNSDGVVNAADLSVLLANFGTQC